MNKAFRVTAVAAFVAAVAFTISYVHTLHLALDNGEGLLTAALNPLVFDGMMIAATISLVWESTKTVRPEKTHEEIAKPKSDLDIMREIWPGVSFLAIAEDQRQTVVRREVGKARERSIGASRANTLIREFLADLDEKAASYDGAR